MQLQDLSYTLNNHKIKLNGELGEYLVSVEVFSLENVYTVKDGTFVMGKDGYVSRDIVWGDTEKVDGEVKLKIGNGKDGRVFDIHARLDRPVRGVKLRFDGLPVGTLISLTDEDKEVSESGMLYHYPEGWRSMSTPLLVFRLNDGKYLYIRCLDGTVNAKRFYIKRTGESMRIDVVEDCDGTQISNSYAAPTVECGIADTADEIYSRHSEYIKNIYGLQEFEKSSIVPKWLKDISLVVTMHMQSFTGHIFHTYESAYRDIEKLTKLIDGKNILVYLAGWEGRYYYKYGDYTPDSRLGGGEKLGQAVRDMQALGCKVIAMYGMNMANRKLPAIEKIANESEFVTVCGGRFHHGSVDWDGAHHYDFDDLAMLNVAAEPWRDCLFDQIARAVGEFGFDGVFLDIAACYVNDRNNKLYEGVVEFCDRLRTIKPDFLVGGEGWYDGLSRAMPLFQSGHTDGWLHYHDRASEKLFTRFSREFAHLCLGDLSRGSSGVHELGENTERIAPLRRGIIPTVALVEDTIEKAYDKIKEVVALSEEYKRKFCSEV